MSDPAEILDEALRLPESERRLIAMRLLDSVGDEPTPEIEQLWVEEAVRRREAVASGAMGLVSWAEVEAQLARP